MLRILNYAFLQLLLKMPGQTHEKKERAPLAYCPHSGRLPGKPGLKNFQFLIFIALIVWGFALRYMPYKDLMKINFQHSL